MRFKQFLAGALGASMVVPIFADGRAHGLRSHTRWHAAAYHHDPYVYRHGPRYRTSFYFGPSAYYGFGYRTYAPAYSYYDYDDEPSYAVTRPNYAGNGLLLGALAGAVIGNNSGDLHHNAWRGAALGAATGYVLGSVAENRARAREAASVTATPPLTTASPPSLNGAAPAAPPVEARPTPPTPTSPMTAANTLFGR